MFDHVTVRVSDHLASRRFYETVLAPLGRRVTFSNDHAHEWSDYAVAQARDDRPLTRRLHVAFVSRSRTEVAAFWRAGVDQGYASDGEPGLRPEYHPEYYGAFLLDPDGNSVEAVYHGRERSGWNVVDHLWIRVGDVDASRRFYETVAPLLGLRVGEMRSERFHVFGDDRSFALVRGSPSVNGHVAFPVADRSRVEAFHRAALENGYRDNGPPGERRYNPGYYGAFVLDPDGNNIEAVHGGTLTLLDPGSSNAIVRAVAPAAGSGGGF